MSKRRKWTDEQLVIAVAKSESYMGVLRELGLKLCGGTHALVKLKIKQLGLNTSHFRGRGWCYGEKYKEFVKNFIEIPLEDILVKESTYQSTNHIKRRLFKAGLLENKCYECEMGPFWRDKPLVMRLDHIDGDRCNNELQNLRLVCPNCDSQSPTFCGRNRTKKIKDKKERKPKEPRERKPRERKPRERKEIVNNFCADCNKIVDNKSIRCKSCTAKLQKNKIAWPTTNELIIMVNNSSFSAVGRQLGVSDNAVRKRIKNHRPSGETGDTRTAQDGVL